MSTTISAITPSTIICSNCDHHCESRAKFCSDCGSIIDLRFADIAEQSNNKQITPNLAFVTPFHVIGDFHDLKAEASKLMLLLARERLFLYGHWLIFLVVNLIGFYMAAKCYSEYIGDDLTRFMMGSTPILYINLLALICIVPIRGTRKSITRLKERLHYVKLQLEHGRPA